MKKKPTAPTPSNACTVCNVPYNKKDFSVCPHCGADGGGTTPRGWRPSKKQAREFAKKKALD